MLHGNLRLWYNYKHWQKIQARFCSRVGHGEEYGSMQEPVADGPITVLVVEDAYAPHFGSCDREGAVTEVAGRAQ